VLTKEKKVCTRKISATKLGFQHRRNTKVITKVHQRLLIQPNFKAFFQHQGWEQNGIHDDGRSEKTKVVTTRMTSNDYIDKPVFATSCR